MTDKEQLEEIKRQSEYIELSNAENFIVYQDMKIKKEHYDWLIEQAERVQELEETVEDYKTVNKELHLRGRKVRKQNKRYREALEIIADKREVDFGNSYTNKAYNHSRKIASKALESEE